MSRTYENGLASILRRAFVSGGDGAGPATLSINQIMQRLEHQALAVLIVLFALPNVVPTPPGTSAVTGLPLVFLCLQMATARAPWLPGFIARREIAVPTLIAVLDKAEPWLHRIERAIHPRLGPLTGQTAQRLVGVWGLFLSALIMLPIPLGNTGPAVALVLLGLGFLGRDGIWVLVGVATGMAAIALLAGVYGAAIMALMAGLG